MILASAVAVAWTRPRLEVFKLMMPAAPVAKALECVDLDALLAAKTVRTAANRVTAVMAKIVTCVPAVLPCTGLYPATPVLVVLL